MPTLLTDYTSYADAQRRFSKPALWELFDGDRDRLNIGHECVDRHPRDQIAVHIVHSDSASETMTFGTLADGSNRFANWLRQRGVGKGARVAIMLEPSPIFYNALFGTMKAGAVAVPMFTLFGQSALAARIEDCTPTLVLTTAAKAALTADCVTTIVADASLTAAVDACSANFTPHTSADDMAMYQYTSGTTRDLPEAVKHRHRAIVTVSIAALYGTGVRPGDRFMCPSSPAWGHGLWHGTLAPLALGVTITSYSGRFNPVRLFDALREFRITNLSAAATHYRMMRNARLENGPLIPKLSFTGEPMDADTAAWARRTFGAPVGSIYGSTEVGVILADYPGAADHIVRPGSLGKPVPGVELAILDPNGTPCPPDTVGEIVLKRRNGWFRTKDRGHVDTDGYFWHDGRADDVIISAGWTISAVEVENALLAHPDVAAAAVIGAPDDARGQVVKAFIVSDRVGDDDFAAELQQIARERQSQHEYPRRIEFVDALPRTPAGKINRRVLRDRERDK